MASREDGDSVEGGDLGLGRGLKPGGLPLTDIDDDDVDNHFSAVVSLPASVKLYELRKTRSFGDDAVSGLCQCQKNAASSLNRWAKQPRQKLKWNGRSNSAEINVSMSDSELQNSNTEGEPVDYPKFAEIPLGTSMRQQRQLYEHELRELFQIVSSGSESEDDTDSPREKRKSSNKLSTLLLQRKLKKAHMEVEILKQDLELCQKQLDAKYKAIRILQKQQFAVHSAHIETARKAKQLNKSMTEEINKLQFEVEHSQSILINSQALWAERFDRVCQENSALMATLELRGDELRKLQNEKMSLTRERDELLALLDIQERQRYESTKCPAPNEAYNNYNTAELAVLGACTCRIKDPEPCACAHAAAGLKKEVCRLQEELQQEKQLKEEALVTTDAYRIAFEEQLGRNRSLVRQIAELTNLNPVSKTSKAKAAIKWLIQQLNEDVPSRPRPTTIEEEDIPNSVPPNVDDILQDKSEQQLLQMLLEMINDRSEALAHQRLAARMLASRTKELEEKLTAVTDDVYENGKT